MAMHSVRRLLCNTHFTRSLIKSEESYRRLIYSIVNRFQSQRSKADKVDSDALKESSVDVEASLRRRKDDIGSYSSGDDDLSESNEKKLELSWLPKALEPALQLCRWVLAGPTGSAVAKIPLSCTRSVSEIITSIQRSKTGIQDWSLSDLTVGLFLIYLRQASVNPFENINGVLVSSDRLVQDLIYHVELAKGCDKDNTAALARNSML